MSATGYTTGDPQKVDVTGDSMTGDLTLSGSATDLSVGGNLTVTGSTALTGAVTAVTVAVSGTVTGSDLVATDDLTVAGDAAVAGNLTVSGSASLSGALDVGGTITGDFQTVTNINVMQLLAMNLTSAVISGGEITVNADPTKIDIAALTGYIVDYDSSAPLSSTNPLLTYVSVAAQVGITPTFAPGTFFSVDSTGTLVQRSTRPTPTQRRQSLTIGSTVSASGVILAAVTGPVIPSQPLSQFQDLTEALGAFSTSGNRISANGSNLSIDKTVGNLFFRSFSQAATYTDPHNTILAAQSPVQFRQITAVPNPASPVVTTLDVANYDPSGSGVVTAVGGGANTATNFRVWATANSTVSTQILVQYGQNTHSSLALAVAAIPAGTYTPHPLAAAAALLGWISVTRTATNLSDPSQATFTFAGKFATP